MAGTAASPLLPSHAVGGQSKNESIAISNVVRSPPFEQEHAIFSQGSCPLGKPQLHLPAIFASSSSKGGRTGLLGISSDDAVALHLYLSESLSVQRLNVIHKHLWLAGLPRNAQPLHRHVLRKREIVITERADHHLLWSNDELLLMPLPAYLLDFDMWNDHICTDEEIFASASGFLLSYMCLICSESDFLLAHEHHVIPKDVTWQAWTALVRSTLNRLSPDGNKDINPRYLYGELRLGRINWIYRCCSKTRSFTTLMRGYSYGYTSYGNFFERNTNWVIAATVYITVVLTAMQVGFGTKELADDPVFSRVSYGFTIFSIAAPIGILALVILILLILIPFNALYAIKQRRRAAFTIDSYDLRKH